MQELNNNFDEALRKKDEQIIRKAERDNNEAQMLRDKIKDLELQLAEKENQFWKANQEKTAIQNELEMQRAKNRETDIDINSLKIEMSDLQLKYNNSQKTITELEALQKEHKRSIQELTEINNQLRTELSLAENAKVSQEEAFQKKAKEIQKVSWLFLKFNVRNSKINRKPTSKNLRKSQRNTRKKLINIRRSSLSIRLDSLRRIMPLLISIESLMKKEFFMKRILK